MEKQDLITAEQIFMKEDCYFYQLKQYIELYSNKFLELENIVHHINNLNKKKKKNNKTGSNTFIHGVINRLATLHSYNIISLKTKDHYTSTLRKFMVKLKKSEFKKITTTQYYNILRNIRDCKDGYIKYRYISYVKLFATTGLRRSEACDLKWSDIERTDDGYIFEVKCQSLGTRTVFMPKDTYDSLSEIRVSGIDYVLYPTKNVNGKHKMIDSGINAVFTSINKILFNKVSPSILRNYYILNQLYRGKKEEHVFAMAGMNKSHETARKYKSIAYS